MFSNEQYESRRQTKIQQACWIMERQLDIHLLGDIVRGIIHEQEMTRTHKSAQKYLLMDKDVQ